MLKTVIGILLVVTGIGDAIKYSIQAHKIAKIKSAKAMSRKFINLALLNDIIRLIYGFILADLFIIICSILALVCMFHLFWMIYQYYPYRMRGCINFKKPSIILYFINSMLPNRIRRKL
jgi:hypothetical protein